MPDSVQIQREICGSCSPKPRIWSFDVVVLPRTTKKCTKLYNARAELFGTARKTFCLATSSLLYIAVVIRLNSLILYYSRTPIKRSPFKRLPDRLSGQLSKSRNYFQYNTVNKTLSKRPPLLNGRGHLLAVPLSGHQ